MVRFLVCNLKLWTVRSGLQISRDIYTLSIISAGGTLSHFGVKSRARQYYKVGTTLQQPMENNIERSPQHCCPSMVPNSQPLDPEIDALDYFATAPQ